MRKSFKVICIILILVVVFLGWQVSKDPPIMFMCESFYKLFTSRLTGGYGGISKWGRTCDVRFDYDTSPLIEYKRRMRLVKSLEEQMPCKEGVWIGMVVTKLGDIYEIHFPIKKGTENDAQTVTTMRSLANYLSTDVFDSQPVEIHISDFFFNTIRVVTQ